MNLAGHGNQMTKSSAIAQNQMQMAHMGQSTSAMASASTHLLGHSPQRMTKQASGYALQGNNMT